MPGGYKANIVISFLDCRYSNSATYLAPMAIYADLKVEHIIDYLLASSRHKYEFDAPRSGRRSWTTDQIILFKDRQWLASRTDTDAAKAAILLGHPSGKATAMARGAYYQ
jgi:hypothetical protein